MTNEQIPTICLNMIVKNESNIILRALESALPIIDCYSILDTGSTDNTVELIKSYFESKCVPGKIVYEPFKNFEHNRNVALKSCNYMSNYILLIDADMILDIRNFKKTDLTSNSYFVLQGSEDFHYNNLRIIKNNGLYSYSGVTHEYLNTPPGTHINTLDKTKLFIKDIGDGSNKKTKYERDIALLLKGIEEEPQNQERYHFYLANSYFDLGKFEEAIEIYKKRITYKGFEQEVWYSYYRIGLCYKSLNQMEKAIYSWLEGYDFFPARLENLYEIVNHYRIIGKHKVCMHFYDLCRKLMKKIKDKDSYLFLSNDVYTYRLEYEYSIIACYVGVFNINPQIITVLNHCNDNNITSNVLSNMKYYKDTLKPAQKIELSDTIKYSINGTLRNFYSSSSTIIKSSNASNKSYYIMNIRYVNYKITDSGSYLDCDDYIITINKYVEMTKDFQITKEVLIGVEFNGKRYIGIEDVRIFNDRENKLIMMGTGLHENGKLGILIGDYDFNKPRLEGCEIEASFTKSECEKNWVFVSLVEVSSGVREDYILYKWYPLLLCSVNANKKVLDIAKINENMPKIFKLARGSTNGCPFRNEIWFVVHIVSYESPRHYYHMLVVFDDAMTLLRYSAPFKFEGEPIEYCLGLIVEEERVIITSSIWDRSTNIVVYDKKYIDDKLVYFR